MMLKINLSLLLCCMCIGTAQAVGLPSIFGERKVELESHLWQSTAADIAQSEIEDKQVQQVVGRSVKEKSPGKAFLLSALIPGLGEWYAGGKTRSAVFLGVEAVLLGLYLNWQGKGKDIEKEFRATAREEWSPGDYLTWRNSTIARNSSITHAMPCSLEVEVAGLEGLSDCNAKDKQQYYELIGKYDQFVSGWSDVKEISTGNLVQPTQVDSAENYKSQLRFTYEDRRNDSNKFLKRASSLAGVILINHAFSAIDAARLARRHNAAQAVLDRRLRFAFEYRAWQNRTVPMLMAYKSF